MISESVETIFNRGVETFLEAVKAFSLWRKMILRSDSAGINARRGPLRVSRMFPVGVLLLFASSAALGQTAPARTTMLRAVTEKACPSGEGTGSTVATQMSAPGVTTATNESPADPAQAGEPAKGVSGQLSPSPAGRLIAALRPAPEAVAAGCVSSPLTPPLNRFPAAPRPSLMRLGVEADKTSALSLGEAVRRALENNNGIEIARKDVLLAESALLALRGVYEPVLSFSSRVENSVSPQSSSLDGSGDSGKVALSNGALRASLTRRMESGGLYEVFFDNTRRSTDSRFNILNPTYSTTLGVTFIQPLLRDREIDRSRRDIYVQRKRLEQSDADFRQRVSEVIVQVQRSYWDLVLALRDQQNRLANLKLAQENARQIEAAVAAGSAAPLDKAEVQTEIAIREADLLRATQNVTLAENSLKRLMLRDSLAPEWSMALIPTDEPSFEADPVDLNAALAEARANRPELRRLRLEEEISGIDIKYLKNQTRPRVDFQATVSTTGLAGAPLDSESLRAGETSPVPQRYVGGYGRSLLNMGASDARNFAVGVTIQLPFKNRTAQANLAGAQLARERLMAVRRDQDVAIEADVRNAAQGVEIARQEIVAARAARESAEKQLEGERRLFQVGRSSAFLLFQRQNQLINTRNQELRTTIDYLKAVAELQRSTSTTLRTFSVLVEPAAGQ